MAAGSHFGCLKITLYRISYHFRSIPQFLFVKFICKIMAAGGHFGCPKITLGRISGHFRSYETLFFIFSLQNGCRWPFWMSENYFRSHFWPFSDRYATLIIFDNMAAVGHFGCPKFTLDHISGHFLDQYRFLICF